MMGRDRDGRQDLKESVGVYAGVGAWSLVHTMG